MKSEPLFTHLITWLLLWIACSNVHADVLDNWSTNQISTNSFAFHHVVYGNGIYVAVGQYSDYGGFYTSANGLDWKLQYTDPNSWGVTLNYSAGRFSTVGPALGSGVANVSLDGTNWTTKLFPSPGYSVTFNAITYGGGLYVIVGSTNSGGSIWASPDGINWTNRQAGGPGGAISDVAFSGTTFVAIGNNDGNVYISDAVGFPSGLPAGISWVQSDILGGSKISYANGLFFVPLNNKTNLLSTDGFNWSPKATGLTNTLGKVTYGHGIFLAQSAISSSGSYLATSADGTNWFQYSHRLSNSSSISSPGPQGYDVSATTDGSRLVTGGGTGSFFYNGYVYTSDPLVGIRLTNTPSFVVALSGLVGRNYQIQSADALSAGGSWLTNLAVQLTNTPYIWTDATTNAAKFYRGVLLP